MSSRVTVVEPKLEVSPITFTPTNAKVDCPSNPQIDKEERLYLEHAAPYITITKTDNTGIWKP